MFKLLNGSYMDEAEANAHAAGPTADQISAASEAGWVPEDKWTGPKDKWIDAATYLERGEKVLPILASNNRKLRAELTAIREEMKQITEDTKAFRSQTEKAVKAEYAEKMREALTAKATAITDGDGEAAVAAEVEVERLKAEQAVALKPSGTAPADGPHPDWEPWKKENPWYDTDEELATLADAAGLRLVRQQPTLKGKALFAAVADAVKRIRPDKFEKEQPNLEQVTGNAERPQQRSGKGKTYADLPSEVKSQFDRFTAKGWNKGTPADKEAYAKTYFEDQ